MAARGEKPLPNLPPRVSHGQDLASLTVPARTHLRRFILRAIEEADAVGDEREVWASVLEYALLELGTSISKGGWLAGLRRRKEAQTRRRRAEAAARIDEALQKAADEEESGKGKGKPLPCLSQELSSAKEEPSSAPANDPAQTWEKGRSARLSQLRELVSKATQPRPKSSANHLLLTVHAFGSSAVLAAEDLDYDFVHAGPRCTFVAQEFALPETDEKQTQDLVLFGVDEWDEKLHSVPHEDHIQIVGGSFQIVGAVSSVHHGSICKVLRLSIYVYLSLLLEQHVLSNSHVQLHFPNPQKPAALAFPVSDRPAPVRDGREKTRRDTASNLWSFFSRKTENILRAANAAPSAVRRGSFDLPLTQKPRGRSAVRPSEGGTAPRPRRFSFVAASLPTSPQWSGGQLTQHVFASAIERIRDSSELLSTSPGIAFTPPRVLLALAEKEKVDATRRLTGDEKAALTSLLGWEGKAALGRGMAGTTGFVRQQGLSVLFSEHVPLPLMVLPQPPNPTATPAPASSALVTPAKFNYCGSRRRWITYRYYDSTDETLGEAITRMCSTAEELCDKPGCQYRRGDHDVRWIHGNVRILATVSVPAAATQAKSDQSDEILRMWESCAICGKESRRDRMTDGTYLFSFAKYLELLIYSPALCVPGRPLCEHTEPPPPPWTELDAPLPRMRMNIYRKFSYKGYTVTISISAVEDIFELRVPRLQIIRRKPGERSGAGTDQEPITSKISTDDDRKLLRREILQWWQGLSEHIDKLEENFASDESSVPHKALPRLPSTDDAYDTYDIPTTSLVTPKARTIQLPHNSSSNSPQSPIAMHANNQSTGLNPVDYATSTSHPASFSSESVLSSGTASSSLSQDGNPILLLSGLRHTFQRTEQTLYAELLKTPLTSLNDVRRSFWTAARGASRRLSAWETKHSQRLPKGSSLIGMPKMIEPEWWKVGCHAVPGGSVIVREDDWGSIIAFTLSSLDYQHELANMSTTIRADLPSVPPSTPSDVRPSFFRPRSSFKRLVGGGPPQPDPDQEGVVWQEPEAHSAVISRKEHPRDPTALTAIREVLRHKPGTDSSVTPTQSKVNISSVPPSARAKPAVELSMQAADGYLSGMPEAEAIELAGKIMQDVEANPSLAGSWHSSVSDGHTSSSGFVETRIRRGKTSSVMSGSSDSTVTADSSPSRSVTPPPLPPKAANTESAATSAAAPSKAEDPTEPTPSTITASLTNTLTTAMRYVLKPRDAGRPLPPPASAHHGLLTTDSPPIDERPHIKYDWTIGRRLKFSCTVYYARQFDALRRRCGIEDVFLRSMAHSENWAAEGGKSRSNFWKTADDRFIIKTLVNAWNVADLQVLIELGPSYFHYVEATASRPTVLAKLLGFYTIEIRNLESGATQAKADLLVMENLFYDQEVSKTFDLKGIQGRKVKAAASSSSFKTLFDGEWIEDQRRALTLVRPYSKVIFQEALKADCDYLAKSNIMDYSLLLGIDGERKEIACGLVDTIGSYTFAKTLEYKAKQGLNSGKEVTVIPPQEYQERFLSAMDDYFLACPDKWSRPLDDTKVPSDYKQLPSVL
ncbi:hypothetical protein B0H21DRAFT_695546 [Amylocystis lapponica]|nr:hypothetical protein B0H21DRAFT_695546 [Amylocystis lapponica]